MNPDINISPDEWEQIERYLQSGMPAAERQAFEEGFANDNGLQAKVREVQLLMLGVQEAGLASQLNRFHQSLPAPGKLEAKKTGLFSARRWLVAASVVLLLAAGCWLLLFRKTENEKHFATYFSPDPGLMTTMGTTDHYTFDRAMVDYKTGNYTAALTAWQSLLPAAPQSDTLNYFIGVALLAKGQPAEAIAYLQKITARPQSYFRPDAYWYLGLALLKEDEKEAAIEAIRQSSHPQKEALLQQLQ